MDSAVEIVNRIPGVDIDSPDFNPNVDFSDNVNLPDGFLNALVSLNDSLPTLDELKDKMNGVIAIPFEALRREIATNLGNVTIERDAFPVPEKENLAFCQVSGRREIKCANTNFFTFRVWTTRLWTMLANHWSKSLNMELSLSLSLSSFTSVLWCSWSDAGSSISRTM